MARNVIDWKPTAGMIIVRRKSLANTSNKARIIEVLPSGTVHVQQLERKQRQTYMSLVSCKSTWKPFVEAPPSPSLEDRVAALEKDIGRLRVALGKF